MDHVIDEHSERELKCYIVGVILDLLKSPLKHEKHSHKCCAVKNNSINAGPSEVTVAYKYRLTARLINKL